VKIRPAISEDTVILMEIERSSPNAAHWSWEQYRAAINPSVQEPHRIVLVVEADDSLVGEGKDKTPALSPQKALRQGRGAPKSYDISAEVKPGSGILVGFLVARGVGSEWELENMVVASQFRRRGIAEKLLDALVVRARAANGRTIYLEVRESNVAARKLYEKAGFQQGGLRRDYYFNPAEHAVLYTQDIV
jgi:ribosomal-protein-alanine acetyltransferase